MPDLLVNLLRLPSLEPVLAAIAEANVVVRRAQPFEITPVRSFVEREFSVAWADEISVGFSKQTGLCLYRHGGKTDNWFRRLRMHAALLLRSNRSGRKHAGSRRWQGAAA